MTPALRTARTLTAAATATTAGAIYLGTAVHPWAALPGLYVATFLAWCAHREYAIHRRILTDHERARRAARLEVEIFMPCCRLANHSDNRAHSPDCRRQPSPDEELAAACCVSGFVYRGAAHEPTCPTRATRSSAA